MPAKIYYDKDADLALLKGKTIAILGYGSQGHAHAQNLRDSGCKVIVAQNATSPNGLQAVKDGFTPMTIAEAVAQADVMTILLPDEHQGEIFRSQIRDNLKPGAVLICSHGFNLHFGQFEVPKGISTVLVAPKGPGHLVRAEYTRGAGVPCLIALGEGASKEAFDIGLAYAKGIGGTRGGVIETTIAEETETDLFGEQAVLCGGVCALMKAGFETLVEAGYQPEMAYFECIHEMKLIVDLIYQGGLSYMRYSISNTAEYGDYTRGSRLVTAETKAEMKRILTEIQDGRFAREWLLENRVNAPSFKAMRRRERGHLVETVGRQLRRLMSWINAKEVEAVMTAQPLSPEKQKQTRDLFDALKPGDRIEVEHFISVGPRSWSSKTIGAVESAERGRHGRHFKRNFDDKVFSDFVLIRRDDGELTTVAIDEFTIMRRI